MKDTKRPVTILMADDDPDDVLLVQDAFEEAGIAVTFNHVPDGIELLVYLNREGQYPEASLPDLILLDLNMPRKNGREVLKEIKTSAGLKSIPVIILSTSNGQSDIACCYESGASAFIVKPGTFDDLTRTMGALGAFWLQVASLPPKRRCSNLQ